MASITDKTVTSKYQPKSTNVIWVDTSLNPPVEKHFVNGRWKSMGGGVSDYSDIKNKPTINGVELDGNKTSSDLGVATSQQGAKADSAYQKPSSGIPESDLSSDVQSQLNKHFKGWFASVGYLETEYPTPVVGDYAYVKGAESTDPAAIYECTTAGSWSDSGRTADTSNVQTFASGEEVNEVHIVNDLITGGVDDVLSAEQGKKIGTTIFGFNFTDNFNITTTGNHSSTQDRLSFNPVIPKGTYNFLIESGTSGNDGVVGLYPHYVGDSDNTNLGTIYINVPKQITLQKDMDSLGLYMSATVNTGIGTMPLKIYSVEEGIKEKVDEIISHKTVLEQVYGNYVEDIPVNGNNRLSHGVALDFRGSCKLTISVLKGVDSGQYKIYRYTNGSLGAALTSTVDFGEYVNINIPQEDDGIWVFTMNTSLTTGRVYRLTITDINGTLENRVQLLEDNEENINDIVGINKFANIQYTASAYDRLSKIIDTGFGGKNVKITMTVENGTDASNWTVYATNNEETAIDVDNRLVPFTPFGKYADIVVPNNGKIVLFTQSTSIASARTYKVDITLSSAIGNQIGNLNFSGKTIVCFGDSITEFRSEGRGYCDWLADYTGATVINVGIGGTQLRQRVTPSTTPSGENQCYAGLDIVNMVKAAMTQDFTIVEASAQELARISADDNTPIIARLESIDWNKVDIVTIFGGTNDWHNNLGNTGNKDSNEVYLTCGAINDIISRIGTTHGNIKLYFLTPLLRFIDAPNFSEAIPYQIGDMCTYNGAYYSFVAQHQGEWSESDVESVPRSAFRIPLYSSDNATINGKTLREFSELIKETVINNHIPVLDLYNNLGWNMYNFGNYFPSYDNTHPYLGFKPLGEKIGKFLMSN